MSFSQPDPKTFTITPLGAAVVEAMPDSKKMRAIERDFKRKRLCPTSAIFPTPRLVRDFYVANGMAVIGRMHPRAGDLSRDPQNS